MKNLFITILCCLLTTLTYAQWESMNGPEGNITCTLDRVGDVLWAGTQGGLYESFDEGESWQRASVLPEKAWIFNVLVTGTARFVVGRLRTADGQSSENRLVYTLNGSDWENVLFPFHVGPGPDPGLLYTNGILYMADGGDLYRFDFDSAAWTEIDLPFSYISKFTGDQNRLLVADFYSLYESTDGGLSWQLLLDYGTQGDIFLEDSLLIVATVGDTIKVSRDIGQTWSSQPAADRFLRYFHRGESGRLYNHGDRVAYSDDHGATWSLVADHPFRINDIMDLEELAGGDLTYANRAGVLKSNLSGTEWHRINTGMVNSSPFPLVRLPNGDLLTGTDGGFMRASAPWYVWEPLPDPTMLTGYGNKFMVQGDSVLVYSDDGILRLSMDNLTTLDSIGTVPISGDQFVRLGARYFLLDNFANYVSDNLLDWYTFEEAGIGLTGKVNQISESADQTLFAVTDDGKVHRSTDDGQSWSVVLEYYAPGVTYHRLHHWEDRILLVDDEDWYFSLDDGLTWTLNNPVGFSAIKHYSESMYRVAIDSARIVAIDSDNVPHISFDYGASWQVFDANLDGGRAGFVQLIDDKLYAGVSGRGVYRYGATRPLATGVVFHDENNNGTREADEPGIPNALVESRPNGLAFSTDSLGKYRAAVLSAADTLALGSLSPYAFASPASHTVGATSSGHNFAVTYQANKNDLRLGATPVEPFRPGFDNTLLFTIRNVGTTDRLPSLRWKIPPAVTFHSASTPPSFVTTDSLTWNLPLLPPGEVATISCQLTVNVSTAIGDVVPIEAVVRPEIGDEAVADNRVATDLEVVGAYDPNDKRVIPAGPYTPAMATDGLPLIYTIRFQNTGNYPAEDVFIIDTISPKLDLISFELLAASHFLTWRMRDERVIEFRFDDIFLPDSVNNEPASHGFVKFSLLPVRELQLGDEIPNFADIYFDFNEPIRTNTAISRYDELSATVLPPRVVVDQLRLAPNPAQHEVAVQIEEPLNAAATLHLYTTSGRLVHRCRVDLRVGKTRLFLPELPTGSYTVVLRSEERRWRGRLVVVGE